MPNFRPHPLPQKVHHKVNYGVKLDAESKYHGFPWIKSESYVHLFRSKRVMGLELSVCVLIYII